MPVQHRAIRGVDDIRTHAGRAEETRLPHQALLRVAWLEMEKHRRVTEKRSASRRVRSIERRLKEIEAEQDELMKKVSAVRRRRPAGRAQTQTAGRPPKENAFKLRY
ncbi:MAG: hypothetical protein ACOC8E_04165 [Planctomycetota bacterium]